MAQSVDPTTIFKNIFKSSAPLVDNKVSKDDMDIPLLQIEIDRMNRQTDDWLQTRHAEVIVPFIVWMTNILERLRLRIIRSPFLKWLFRVKTREEHAWVTFQKIIDEKRKNHPEIWTFPKGRDFPGDPAFWDRRHLKYRHR